jgi:hypothetical protein
MPPGDIHREAAMIAKFREELAGIFNSAQHRTSNFKHRTIPICTTVPPHNLKL